MKPEQVQKIIADGLQCEGLSVQGDDNSPKALIVSSQFVGKSRVQRQQHVYQTLKEKLATGELHALSFKTLTPEEWSAQRG